MRRFLLLAAPLLLVLSPMDTGAIAQTRRALLVAINRYAPPPAPGKLAVSSDSRHRARGTRWIDLEGPRNDVKRMREMLLSRLGFSDSDIRVLQDDQATRKGILDALDELALASGKGDVALFVYAGHGSQVRNPDSREPDHMDETLVPFDAMLAQGPEDLRDITDKELAVRLNRIADRGAVVTAIVDSCHSGSISRGRLDPAFRARRVEPVPWAVHDARTPVPPEQRGALILSASQDWQLAGEIGEKEQAHGVMTSALVEMLDVLGPDVPVERLFAAVRGRMYDEKPDQEPALAADPTRRQRPLLGVGRAVQGRPVVTVGRVRAEDDVHLLAGAAMGLRPGCELVPADENTNPGGRLKVTEVDGAARSRARLAGGSLARLAPGTTWVVDRWTVDTRDLALWIPPSAERSVLERAVGLAKRLRNLRSLTWVEDPREARVDVEMSFNGRTWVLAGAVASDLGASPSAGDAEAALKALGGRPAFYLRVPPTRDLDLSVFQAERILARVVDEPAQARYMLAGRVHEDAIEYGWLQPDLRGPDVEPARTLPVGSDWVPAADKGPVQRENLLAFAQTLAWAAWWVNATGTQGEAPFPYRLELRKDGGGQGSPTEVVEGEKVRLVLVGDAAALAGRSVPQIARYVYVFLVDACGGSQVLWPRGGAGEGENRLPARTEPEAPAEIVLSPGDRPLAIGCPFGIDRYYLLTTRERLVDPVTAFSHASVCPVQCPVGEGESRAGGATGAAQLGMSRGGGDAACSDLECVLARTRRGVRGVGSSPPADWSLQALPIRSVAGPRP